MSAERKRIRAFLDARAIGRGLDSDITAFNGNPLSVADIEAVLKADDVIAKAGQLYHEFVAGTESDSGYGCDHTPGRQPACNQFEDALREAIQ